MKKKRILITDHALVRYLERVGGFDLESLRMALERRLQDAATVKAAAVKLEGHIYCLGYRDGNPALITVLDEKNGYDCHIPEERQG